MINSNCKLCWVGEFTNSIACSQNLYIIMGRRNYSTPYPYFPAR